MRALNAFLVALSAYMGYLSYRGHAWLWFWLLMAALVINAYSMLKPRPPGQRKPDEDHKA